MFGKKSQIISTPASSSTKAKILESALELFNRKGFVNVTLRDIAAVAGLSTGNLAYHYKNKDALIGVLYEQMQENLQQLMHGVRLIPSFENIDNQIIRYLGFQHTYRFFFLDTLELSRAYPHIAINYRQNVRDQVLNIRAIIDYSVGCGNMLKEPSKGIYNELAHNVWMILCFWLEQTEILQTDASNNKPARFAIWSMVIPHLTLQGMTNFKKIELQLQPD